VVVLHRCLSFSSSHVSGEYTWFSSVLPLRALDTLDSYSDERHHSWRSVSRRAWRSPVAQCRFGQHNVATCGYNLGMSSTGIRELKNNLSRYIRRIEAGERIAITAHGRVVAELVPPGTQTKGTASRFDELVASGVIRPPLEAGDPTEGWPDIRLPAGTAAELIDADRGEA